jgi:hypothetical protein
MPLLLRTITRSQWLKTRRPAWLPEGECTADALRDLETENNELSVWQIGDDKGNLDQVITALAAGRDAPSRFDYALFDRSRLDPIGIQINKTPGITLDDAANNAWHHDLVELTGSKLLGLARVISEEATAIERKNEKEMNRLIVAAVKERRIELRRLGDRMQQKIRPALPPPPAAAGG